MTISDRLSTDELEIRVQERTAELKKANQELSRRNLVLEGINRIFNIVVQEQSWEMSICL
jgi:nitrate/nitrite-specific signal transduction histidine kinase